MKNTWKSLTALTGLFALTTTGCFGVGDIDRTQPEKVRKCIFFEEPCADLAEARGEDFVAYSDRTPAEYYFRSTVIDVPATSGLSFVGEQGKNELIVWDIQRDFIFAYRAYPWYENTREANDSVADGYTRPDTGAYQGSPIAAFRIMSHFDVQRQYNTRTGEQTNLIVENMSDRLWYERDYIRVDWANNLISDFQFGAAAVKQAPVGMYIQAGGDVPETNNDSAKITRDYIDIVQRMTAQPELNQLYTQYFGFPILECYLYSSVMNDCNGVNLRVRHSFMRRKPSNYQALEYDDARFSKFGYFRTERYTYDPDYGAIDYAASRLANRWNIWGDNKDCYDPQAELPYGSCDKDKLKPIVYHLNADFPMQYIEFARSNADEWNTVFQEAISAGSGWDVDDIMDMFVICENNPVQAGDPAVCGEEGISPQIGDLRYSMYYFLPNEQSSSPLGYGPSADDPLTGELIQGNAFYYGAPGRWIARRTMDIFKYEKGLLTAEEIGAAVPARNAVSAALNRENSSIARRGAFDFNKVKRTFDQKKILEKADRLQDKLHTGEAFHDMSEANLTALKNSPLNDYMLTDEIRKAFMPEFEDEYGTWNEASEIKLDKLLSKDLFNYQKMREERLLNPKAGGCILMADAAFDEGYNGLFFILESKFMNGDVFDEEAAFTWLVGRTMGDTQLHEIGHTVGLRHNFAGTTDAINFNKTYWDLKGGYTMNADGSRPKPEWELTASDLEQFGTALKGDGTGVGTLGLRDYQTSSVMDYASVYGTNTRLGKYDAAAIKYAYADMVEVFDTSDPTVDVTADRADLLRRGTMHYTYYPEAVSSAATYAERTAALYKRNHKNYRLVGENDVEVPYAFCSDEYRGGSEVCNLWDMGLDNYERAFKKANDYRNYYIFNAFKRERVGFGVSPFDYIARVYNRSFVPMLDQYKNWVNEELIIRRDDPCQWYANGQLQTDPDRFTADACGLHGYVAATEVMNLLAEVIQVPALGCYTRLNTGCYEASGSVGKSGIDETGLTKVSDDPEACDTHVIAPNDDGEIERVALKIPANAPYYHINDSTTCDGWNGVIDADTGETLSVDPKEFGIADGARPERTTYDRDVFGYYFYWKPTAMGYWWDKWMAIKALSDPYTDFIGVDSSSDQASYAISLSTLFAEDINNLVGGLIIERPDLYAGRLDADGKYEPLKAIGLYANDTVDRPTSDSVWVDPDQQYTLQLIGMMNVAYQAWNIDGFDFANSMNIGIHYDPSQIVPDDVRNDPTRYIELTEPATGLKFFSVNNERYLDQAEERPFLSVGFQYISDVKNRLYEGGAAGPGTDVLEGYYGWQVEGDTRVMRIMSASSDLFGGASVWSGDIQF